MDRAEQSFGDRVRQARERIRTSSGRRMTQGELADAVSVKRNTVSRWENGEVQPKDPAQLLRLARVLRVPTDWLIGGTMAVASAQAQPPSSQLGEGTPSDYPREVSGELPPAAATIVGAYLDRLARAGCTPTQCAAAESLFVAITRNVLSPTPLDARTERDIVADADAAWDVIVGILRRDGVRP